jgi:thiamine biosynthesis protein ThiC
MTDITTIRETAEEFIVNDLIFIPKDENNQDYKIIIKKIAEGEIVVSPEE